VDLFGWLGRRLGLFRIVVLVARGILLRRLAAATKRRVDIQKKFDSIFTGNL
jgi:hypothetical protein